MAGKIELLRSNWAASEARYMYAEMAQFAADRQLNKMEALESNWNAHVVWEGDFVIPMYVLGNWANGYSWTLDGMGYGTESINYDRRNNYAGAWVNQVFNMEELKASGIRYLAVDWAGQGGTEHSFGMSVAADRGTQVLDLYNQAFHSSTFSRVIEWTDITPAKFTGNMYVKLRPATAGWMAGQLYRTWFSTQNYEF